MYQVDARGLSCPAPVLHTPGACKAQKVWGLADSAVAHTAALGGGFLLVLR